MVTAILLLVNGYTTVKGVLGNATSHTFFFQSRTNGQRNSIQVDPAELPLYLCHQDAAQK